MEDRVAAFLRAGNGHGLGRGDGSGNGDGDGRGSGYGNGRGDGDGRGSGYGRGDGYGRGYGDGNGSGYGDGRGYGDGYGYGSKRAVKSVNGMLVHNIDEVATTITQISHGVAKGFILNNDLSLTPTFVVRDEKYYAHGETVRKAYEALREKRFEDMPEEERIEAFVAEHGLDKTYPTKHFFDWHNRLTGSCEQGRLAFARDKGIDLNGEMTTREFLELTKDKYGGETIQRVIRGYNND